jgi:hypothetical protein
MTLETHRQSLNSGGLSSQLLDLDPAETQEWRESLDESSPAKAIELYRLNGIDASTRGDTEDFAE